VRFQLKPPINIDIRVEEDGLISFIRIGPNNYSKYTMELEDYNKYSCFYTAFLYENGEPIGKCTISSYQYVNYKINVEDNQVQSKTDKKCVCSSYQLLHKGCTCGYSSGEKIKKKYDDYFK
jgi:hypothetical protein